MALWITIITIPPFVTLISQVTSSYSLYLYVLDFPTWVSLVLCVFCFECHSFYEASSSDLSLAVITFSSGSHRRILFCLFYGTARTCQLFVYMPLSLTRPESHCAGLSGRPLCLPLRLVQFPSHSGHLISVG